MGDASVNGEKAHSVTLEHVTSYPVVQDLIEYVKNNPYGQKSINLTDAAYNKLFQLLAPYLETPAAYAKPYAIKIDEFGNVFLDKFDEKVPVIKSETKEVKSAVIAYVNWPVEKATDAKSKVFDVYNKEYKRCGGDGYVAGGKAIITTGLNLSQETLGWIADFLVKKKEEAKEKAGEAKEAAQETGEEAKEKVDEKTSE